MRVVRRLVDLPASRFGPRSVHHIEAGAGPPVLALHPSPRRGAVLAGIVAEWAGPWRVAAPDMPGYGASDPLAGGPDAPVTLDDLAEATVEWMDGAGIDRAAVYGEHTGAMLGLVMAVRHPDRVVAVAANGVALLRAAERADWLAHHLPPFVPDAGGSHLADLWARARAQHRWFPWFRQDDDHRHPAPSTPSPADLHAYVADVVAAGDHYRVAYRAALAHDLAPTLAALTVPALVTAAAADPLAAHLDRIGSTAPVVTVVRGGLPVPTREGCRTFLAAALDP